MEALETLPATVSKLAPLDFRLHGPPTPPDESTIHFSLASKPHHTEPFPRYHPFYEQVKAATDAYILTRWTFSTEKAKKKFLAADFAGLTCLCFPSAPLDQRIATIAKLFAVAFLIDDMLEQPGFKGDELLMHTLESAMRGCMLPEEGWHTAARLLYDIFHDARRYGSERLVEDLVIAMTGWLRAANAQPSTSLATLSDYFDFRYQDVATPLVCAIPRYLLDCALSVSEIESMLPLERNIGRHFTVINDLHSWNKEYAAHQAAIAQGVEPNRLVNAVYVMSEECGIAIEDAQTVLSSMVGAWERRHVTLVGNIVGSGEDEKVAAYLEALAEVMQGHKDWCDRTARYAVCSAGGP
ncbi:hypothetical protein BAUCODRAFT_152112 [Baudoinia panamericana UAMH 10762]|uniref:Terpene synthase n=1 Tax=Baudoinia panamericana (strain UAMH 10762) TaxID=717646 RepID=M2MYI8_BAUPA|nr:uncharacterized protein BAUCODRAFT_152112 [Baudoinia panamericana UAMH 10762]EMC91724.1 hypothetical protein BAUCODRAFT_152112 [Baudoinia panamericana UAMH 10762]